MSSKRKDDASLQRRDFLKVSAATVGAIGAGGIAGPQADAAAPQTAAEKPSPAPTPARRAYNTEYRDEHLNRVAFPLGGMGAGMICLEGTRRPVPRLAPQQAGGLQRALHLRGHRRSRARSKIARVLEGPVPGWKLFGQPGTGNGAGGTSFGLPRFREAALPRALPLRHGHAPTSQSPAGGRDHRLEPLRAGRRRQRRACRWPPWSTASRTDRRRRSRRSSP